MRLKPKEYHCYSDESCTGDHYMVFGGIVMPARDVDTFNARMDEWRVKNNMMAELKWTKVSDGRYTQYRSLIDLFFKHNDRFGLHFKAVVFDMSQVDYKAYHHGDKELGFYKFYYHFFLHRFADYARDETYSLYVYMDQRPTNYSLGKFRTILNAGIRKHRGLALDVVRAVEPRDSKTSNLLQLADVLMGAVGWHCNDSGDAPGARQAKKDLAAYIATKARLPSLKGPSPWGQLRFNIFRLKFSGLEKRPGA